MSGSDNDDKSAATSSSAGSSPSSHTSVVDDDTKEEESLLDKCNAVQRARGSDSIEIELDYGGSPEDTRRSSGQCSDEGEIVESDKEDGEDEKEEGEATDDDDKEDGELEEGELSDETDEGEVKDDRTHEAPRLHINSRPTADRVSRPGANVSANQLSLQAEESPFERGLRQAREAMRRAAMAKPDVEKKPIKSHSIQRSREERDRRKSESGSDNSPSRNYNNRRNRDRRRSASKGRSPPSNFLQKSSIPSLLDLPPIKPADETAGTTETAGPSRPRSRSPIVRPSAFESRWNCGPVKYLRRSQAPQVAYPQPRPLIGNRIQQRNVHGGAKSNRRGSPMGRRCSPSSRQISPCRKSPSNKRGARSSPSQYNRKYKDVPQRRLKEQAKGFSLDAQASDISSDSDVSSPTRAKAHKPIGKSCGGAMGSVNDPWARKKTLSQDRNESRNAVKARSTSSSTSSDSDSSSSSGSRGSRGRRRRARKRSREAETSSRSVSTASSASSDRTLSPAPKLKGGRTRSPPRGDIHGFKIPKRNRREKEAQTQGTGDPIEDFFASKQKDIPLAFRTDRRRRSSSSERERGTRRKGTFSREKTKANEPPVPEKISSDDQDSDVSEPSKSGSKARNHSSLSSSGSSSPLSVSSNDSRKKRRQHNSKFGKSPRLSEEDLSLESADSASHSEVEDTVMEAPPPPPILGSEIVGISLSPPPPPPPPPTFEDVEDKTEEKSDQTSCAHVSLEKVEQRTVKRGLPRTPPGSPRNDNAEQLNTSKRARFTTPEPVGTDLGSAASGPEPVGTDSGSAASRSTSNACSPSPCESTDTRVKNVNDNCDQDKTLGSEPKAKKKRTADDVKLRRKAELEAELASVNQKLMEKKHGMAASS